MAERGESVPLRPHGVQPSQWSKCKNACTALCHFIWPTTLQEWRLSIRMWACIAFTCSVIQGIETSLVLCKRAHPATECIEGGNGTVKAVRQQLEVEYTVYYLGFYGFIGLLRVIEFILLGTGLWKLANGIDKEMVNAFAAARLKLLQMCSPFICPWTAKNALLLLMVLSSLTYFALGIAVEMEYANAVTCLTHTVLYHILSSLFNFITHTIYIAALVMMMGAEIAMEWMLSTKGTAAEDREKQYKEDGKRLRLLNKVFQPWFLLPVVIVLIKMKMPAPWNRLKPWAVDDKASELAVSYELVHLVYQVLLLIILIDTAYGLTAVHKKHLRRLRRLGPVQEDERNIFSPNLGNTIVPLNSVVSIFVTLLGVMIYLGEDFFTHLAV